MRRRHGAMKSQKLRKAIGIIAEDKSDIEVIDILIGKITKAPYRIRSFKGEGHGKIAGKCHSWGQILKAEGCKYLLLVHDLDSAKTHELRTKLEGALSVSPIQLYLIVIPVREIEAWLLADHEAITKAMKLREKLNLVANPEAIQNPKEQLGRLIRTKSRHKQHYVNTVDNKKIAAECVPTKLRRCPSFVPFEQFITQHI
jgi:hypothetical protein